MSNKLTRRGFVAAGISTLALAAGPAFALTEGDARKLVQALVTDINRVISSGKSESAMLSDFQKLFDRYADVPVMARYALGVDGRSASRAQMNAFTKAFSRYISRKYGRRFREFIGGEVQVKSARAIKAGYEIRCTAKLKGQAPFEVTFLVSSKSGRDKFFNMFIEGVNLLLTERTEIGAMLDKRGGDLNKLTADLKKI